MRKLSKALLGAAILALTAAGCGSSSETVTFTPNTAPAPSNRALIDQAMVNNPEVAVKLVPRDHLNPPLTPRGIPLQGASGSQTISVADLETNYETIFASLSSTYNVTLSTPEAANNISFIKSQSGTGNFDLLAKPILNNPLGVTGVNFQPINYTTTVPLPEGERTFQVSGGLLMPVGIDKSQIKGVITYFHGTTFAKNQVGSNFQNSETQLCAEVFASQGYIVAIPDYVGQGVDWGDVHPYVLYPKASAQAAADLLTAVKPTISSNYAISDDEPALKLFATGYSEGGAYSLWFHTYVTDEPSVLDPFYDLTHSVGMEGAYSVSDITYNYLFDDVSDDQNGNTYNIQSLPLVNIVKPLLSADAFLSYATYTLNGAYNGAFSDDFFNMKASPPVPPKATEVNGQAVTIAAAFALPSTDISSEVVAAGLGKRANGAKYPGFLELLTDSKNSVNALVSAAILEKGPMDQLKAVMAAADVDLTNVPDGEVSVVTLDKDSVVTPNNFDLLTATFPGKFYKAEKVDHSQLLYVSPFSAAVGFAYWAEVDHLQGAIFEFLYTLNIFNEQAAAN